MNADLLISLVLDEGKVRHLVLPKFDIKKVLTTMLIQK